MRPTYAEISLNAIAHNTRAFVDLVAPSAVCAVVKADGYGHGDVPVANAALNAGAQSVAVALVAEGIRLREAGVAGQVLILSEPPIDTIPSLVEWGLTPTVYSQSFVESLTSTGVELEVQVKVDTGMHRVGVPPRVLHDLIGAIRRSDGLRLGGIWTHFAVADEDPEYTRDQIRLFDRSIEGIDVPVVHMANTAGAALFPEARRDLCRIGLGIYGLHPAQETRDVIALRPAMRIVSRITHLQHLEAGERPSYGRRRPLRSDSTIATVPIGYADGFSRALSDYGSALIGGHRFPLAGTVTMDQVVVDVGDADVHVGDEVVLLGQQGDDMIAADEWAEMLGTISYEIVCGIGPRVPRRYSGE